MSDVHLFEPFSDEEIRQAARRMGLPDNAFWGEGGRDPRAAAFRSLETVDVAACPGSGKTTLLVAKLAALAEKWRSRTQGICVLSHTNVARRKIESSLGNSSVGRRLLSYPHFIGTIHGFVNEFLALPFLRSMGYGPVQFSNDIVGDRQLRSVQNNPLIQNYLSNNFTREDDREKAIRTAHYQGEDCDIALSNKALKRSGKSPTFNCIDKLKKRILAGGFASHGDSLAFAHCALKKQPFLVEAIQERFPIFFLDEAQDNSEEQSLLLRRIFLSGKTPVIRQRFGDKNQAIFDEQGAEDASTDPFPCDNHIIALPSSHRFGQRIADLADPLGLVPYRMQGLGPKTMPKQEATEGRHTIFLFKDEETAKVLEAYACLLLETFSPEELNTGSFVAVGHVHLPSGKEEEHQFPKCLRHYWPDYDPNLAGRDPKPKTLVDYFFSGLTRAEESREFHPYVEMIAGGILRLAHLGGQGKRAAPLVSGHRHLLKVLEANTGIRASYLDLVSTLTLKKESLSQGRWEEANGWASKARKIAETVCETVCETACEAALNGPEVDAFLAWPVGEQAAPARASRSNVFSYPANDPKVHIKLGSIHSVKGETHTAVLVLETYYYDHNLEKLLPWLIGTQAGKRYKEGIQQLTRLKIHYVAMTRPTHLLCLAMKRSSFENKEGELDDEKKEQLQERGWRVVLID